MWVERYAEVCWRLLDVVAVFESSSGRLALLLRHRLSPSTSERRRRRAETQLAAVRRIIAALSAAGLNEHLLVVQWLPPRAAAEILSTWRCRFDSDPVRRAQLFALASRHIADERCLRSRAEWVETTGSWTRESGEPPRLTDDWKPALRRWYRAMAPCWLATEPPLRRRLVLVVHIWIAERILADAAQDRPRPAAAELRQNGRLARALARHIPPRQLDDWRSWTRLVLADLGRAIAWPRAERDEAWGRWLFLVPYRVPVPTASRTRPTMATPAGTQRSA